VKLDENVPLDLRPALEALGYDVDDVVSEGLSGCEDEAVWAAAQEAGRFLVTLDLDFSDVRVFPPGSHCGILVVRLTGIGRAGLTAGIQAAFREEGAATWPGCLVVLADYKVRVRRP
jgi:predicted nuclease of predicted toxin-antitoxin system